MPSSYVACVAGQKSLASQTHYMSQTDTTLKATSRMMQNVINGESATSSNFGEILAEEKMNEAKRIASLKPPDTPDIAAATSVIPQALVPKEDNIDLPETETNKENVDPPETDEAVASIKHESKGSTSKKSKKRRKKHRRRSPSTSSSSSDSSSSSSDDEKEKLKRKIKKMEKQMRKMKENVPPPPQGMMPMMMMPMMMQMPMNMTVPGPSNFQMPQFQHGESGQVMSQITQHTVKKAAATNNNSLFLQDEFD